MARIIFDKLLPHRETDTDRELADYDLEFLLDYLSCVRGTTYDLIERPDENTSEQPAPDYLLKESPTDRIIAVEHTRLMDEDLQRASARLFRDGAGIVTRGASTDPKKNGQALREAVARKLAHGQLQGTTADERILLIHNRRGTAKTYLNAQLDFTTGDKAEVDSAFLIASDRLLELW